jgi:preprotein translocase subunit SecD
VFFFFTKPMMTYLARRRFFNTGHRLSGLSSETLGIDEPTNAQLVGGRA